VAGSLGWLIRYCPGIRYGVGKPSMSHRRVDGRGRYGKEYGNSLVRRRTDKEDRRAASPSKG